VCARVHVRVRVCVRECICMDVCACTCQRMRWDCGTRIGAHLCWCQRSMHSRHTLAHAHARTHQRGQLLIRRGAGGEQEGMRLLLLRHCCGRAQLQAGLTGCLFQWVEGWPWRPARRRPAAPKSAHPARVALLCFGRQLHQAEAKALQASPASELGRAGRVCATRWGGQTIVRAASPSPIY